MPGLRRAIRFPACGMRFAFIPACFTAESRALGNRLARDPARINVSPCGASAPEAYTLLRTTMRRTRLLLALSGLLLLYPLFARHRDVTTEPYDVDEAYKVYSAILPSGGERPLVIGTETQTAEICLQPLDAQSEKVLRPAIDNFLELNALQWHLQKHFDVNRRYELVAEEELKATFRNGMDGRSSLGGWKTFYERHPDSEGFIELSAVGFNADKTIAVVFIGYHCGEECRGGEFRALEKKNGKWQLLTGKGLWNHCVWYVRDHRA
jgi:hypothetical protein